MTNARTLNVDHLAAPVTAEGIEELFWPLRHTQVTHFGERYMFESARILQDAYPDGDVLGNGYKFAMKYFIAEAGGLFQAELLRTGLAKANIAPIIPPDWTIWPHTFNHRYPPRSGVITRLRNSAHAGSSLFQKLMDPARILKLLRRLKPQKGGLALDGLKIKPLTPQLLQNAIIATQRTDLIIRHAGEVQKEVVLCRSPRWFSEITDADIKSEQAQADETMEARLVGIARALFAENGLELPEFMREGLTSYLQEISILLRIHYRRLLTRTDLPAELWTGTGGDIWDLMLRAAVIAKGGKVVGHDHGGGTAHVGLPLVGFIELWACSAFYTFNETQVAELGAQIAVWPQLERAIPRIGCPDARRSKPREIVIKERFLKPDPAIKKIYVPSTLYDRDRGRSFAFYPDLVYVDWQARLLAHLREWGYQVLFKPHPESRAQPPAAFFEELGARMIHGRFEEVMEEADLFLFDYTYTSIMLPAFMTNIPIVLVDFEGLHWYDKARHMAEQRCNIIDCGFNESGRVALDWDILKKALETASGKCNNHDYALTYYA